jgi:hypothetical protein
MQRILHAASLASLLLLATPARAEISFAVAPSVGGATISNFSNYRDSAFARVDGTFFLLPEFGFNVFGTGYSGFETRNGNEITIKVSGVGAGVIGRWPVHPHVQPYARLEYFSWRAEASGLNTTLGTESGGSPGLAIGLHFPIKKFFGLKAEVAGYNKVSDANIRQISIGGMFEF